MIGKLAARDSRTGRQCKPQIHQSRGKGQTEITIRETIRTGSDQITCQIVVTEDNTDKIEVGLDMNKIIGEVTLEEM